MTNMNNWLFIYMDHIMKLELVICPRENTGYIPEGFTDWPFWCPRDCGCSQLKFWLKFYTYLRDTWGYPNTSDGQLSSQFQEAPRTNYNSFVFTCMYVILAISDQYATFFFLFFSQNCLRWPLWMTENHFRSHFSPFHITMQLISRNIFLNSQNGRRRPFWMTENHFRSHFSPFQINTQLSFFWIFFHKMAAGGHFGWPKITFDRISGHFISIRNFHFV